MLKKLIAPLQKILLQKKLCPGCTQDLTKAKKRSTKTASTEFVHCECGRIFIYDRDLDLYRRALVEETR
jgi:hypothetical protein